MGKNERTEEGRQQARQLTNSLNLMGGERQFIEGFLEEILDTHCTLQQAFGRLLLAALQQGAKQYAERNFDLRNEAYCQMCKACTEALKREGFIGLPLI